IKLRTKNHSKISLKEIKEKFLKAPYGFLDLDIEWIIAKLFVDGNISFTLNGETVSLVNEPEEEIINYITKRQYVEKLLIEEKEIVDERYIRSLKNISSVVFGRQILVEDTDMMVKKFNEYAENLIGELNLLKEKYDDGEYPGEAVIEEGIILINKTRGISKPIEIFKELNKNEDEYLDFEEDYQPIKSFFKGEQKNIWEKTQHFTSIYNESKSYILNDEIEEIVQVMKKILAMAYPYNRIKDLPELNSRFLDLYDKILEKELEPVKIEIKKAENRVMEELERTGLEDRFKKNFRTSFNDLTKRAESCNNVAKINGFRIEAETLKDRYLKEISKELDRQKKKEEEEKKEPTDNKEPTVKEPIIKRKYINIREINLSNSWRIENSEDIDRYLRKLKENLEKELEENTILNIEF
ncbi:MAG TPA: hypothetical protein VK071_04705, partial [Tissierellales bacterium]|nr:hypothetical protein [Tissierellales bacterium]